MRNAAYTLCLALAGLTPFASGSIHAETLQCTPIGSLQYSVMAPGTYCLTKNLTDSSEFGAGISIQASDVILDCNGHTLTNTRAGNYGYGVQASGAVHDVTVRNCQVKGYRKGISFTADNQDVTLKDNTILRPEGTAIEIVGSRTHVVGNLVVNAQYLDNGSFDPPIAIYIHAAAYDGSIFARDVVIRGNRILGFTGSERPEGIRLDYVDRALIQDNHVAGLDAGLGGMAWGIVASSNNGGTIIRDNVVMGILNRDTIGVSTWGTPSTCLGNLVVGASTAISGCDIQTENIVR